MIKRYFLISISLLVALIWATGCSSFPGTSKTTSKSPQGKNLYSRVPAAMRAPVKEASYDLKKAQANLKLSGEKVKLAELVKERAILEKKYADYNQGLAGTAVKKAEVTIERRRLEAIDNANLGDKASNINGIAKLRTKELGIEADYVNTKASMATLALEIKKLNKKVSLQTAKVNGASGKKRK